MVKDKSDKSPKSKFSDAFWRRIFSHFKLYRYKTVSNFFSFFVRSIENPNSKHQTGGNLSFFEVSAGLDMMQ